jgi:SAM-dependent methyltransferase
LRSGQDEVGALMTRAAELNRPLVRSTALDFGCGVGRVTRALAGHFEQCTGLDISGRMVERAKAINNDLGNCTFIARADESLQLFTNDEFDLVYSRLVLQHVPWRDVVRAYIREFVRVLRPDGLLVFQLPSAIPIMHRIQPRPRIYEALRRLGVHADVLYRLGLQPIRMSYLPMLEVRAIVAGAGGRVLMVETRTLAGGVDSSTYYVSKHGPHAGGIGEEPTQSTLLAAQPDR